MASPWEVHVAGAKAHEVLRLTQIAADEAQRIERKFSRYRPSGVVHEINAAQGGAVRVDAETARLLDYADTLWRTSDGLFDITTGVLRRAWTFDGSDRIPSDAAIASLMPLVGWRRVEWDGATIRMPAGMEIDFGGIGKEYAVDRALALVRDATKRPVLVNGGGDLAASAPPADGEPWRVGIDHIGSGTAPTLRLYSGGVATSGDANRFLLRDGVRYSHVLDPRTGRPVPDAPASVTVLADTCSEAGSHSTIALLQGARAESWLTSSGVSHWVRRDASPLRPVHGASAAME